MLRYLYATKDMGLVYDESQSVEYEYGQGVKLEFEVDSDFGGRLELGGKSTTGWVCKANNSVVYSGCVIQKRVATSTTEAESNGLETVCKEAQWYRDFLNPNRTMDRPGGAKPTGRGKQPNFRLLVHSEKLSIFKKVLHHTFATIHTFEKI